MSNQIARWHAEEHPQEDPFAEFHGDDWIQWRNALAKSKVYLEYGCGQSTRFVAEHFGCKIRSVDTSPEWAAAVSEALGKRGEVLHIDLGPVGPWGRPRGYDKAESFSEYFNAGFEDGFNPDVVLIDGRFRVSVFLTVLMRSRAGTQIIFDDYAYRPHYHVVEQILNPVTVNERQALFIRPEQLDMDLLDFLVSQFSMVMD